MRSWTIAFSAGVVIAGFVPRLPSSEFSLLFVLPLLLSIRLKAFRLAGAFGLGIAWFLVWALFTTASLLPESLEREDLLVTGVVSELPRKGERSTRFVLTADGMCREGDQGSCSQPTLPVFRGKLLLSDYGQGQYMPGQRWRLLVRLKRPHGFANPGGFDYEAWLLQQGITATGYVRASPGNQLLAARGPTNPLLLFERLRYEFQSRVERAAPVRANFIKALTIGDRNEITDTEWNLLTVTGTNHLMVISGLHIGLVALLVSRTAALIFRLFSFLCPYIPSLRLSAAVAALAAFFYAGLAGFSLPVQRALIMVCCFIAGQLLVRRTSPFNNLCLALVLVLLVDPLAPQSPGFWLSFLAVGFLLLAVFRMHDDMPSTLAARMSGLLRSQYFLFLGMLPVMILLFQQVSLMAPFVNLLAIPFIGLVVVPGCLLALVIGFVAPAWFPHVIALPDILLGSFLDCLQWLVTHLDFLLVSFPALPPALIAILMTAAVLLLLMPGRTTAALFLAGAGMAFLYRPERLGESEFTMDILDVGQGLAVVVSTRGHVLVYDSGPAYSARFNAGSGIVEPFLRAVDARMPDTIIISHGDSDHAGGLPALAASYPDARYITGEPVAPAGIESRQCLSGQHWEWDGVLFEFLHPGQGGESGNNASCVLRISAGNHAALLPGDIEGSVERLLVTRQPEALRADVLIAPHHGSKTSSTPMFVGAVDPAVVVFSSGYLNRFNHPHPDVTARYARLGSLTLNTSETGAVHIRISAGQGVRRPLLYRLQRRRFWSFL